MHLSLVASAVFMRNSRSIVRGKHAYYYFLFRELIWRRHTAGSATQAPDDVSIAQASIGRPSVFSKKAAG